MLMKVGSKGWVTNRSHDLPERVAMKANKWLRGSSIVAQLWEYSSGRLPW